MCNNQGGITVGTTGTTYGTIRLDQLLINSDMHEHRCLENINKLYQSSRKYNDQQQYKTIIEAPMVSTT